jgi:twitching motility protein PilT
MGTELVGIEKALELARKKLTGQSTFPAVYDTRRMQEIVHAVLTPRQIEVFESENEVDFSLQGKARFRGNFGKERRGVYGTFRVIPSKIRNIRELGLPNEDICNHILQLQEGLVLVTGVTGSGKTTTLASLVQAMNETQNLCIITVEDPIEYVFEERKSLVIQREVNVDTNSFYAGVKYSMRQDPDVIVIGEIRDPETAMESLRAAETGHLVLSSLHSEDVAGAIDRFIGMFKSEEQDFVRSELSRRLECVIAQKLIPYRGAERTLVTEIAICTPAMRNYVRENKTEQIISAIQTGGQYGMISMDKCLQNLYDAHKITQEEVLLQHAKDRVEMERFLVERRVARRKA